MRALMKLHAGPGLELREIPEPEPGAGEVKIRVMRAGICGTDLHIEDWDPWAAGQLNPPMSIGHEFYGEIVDIGPDVTQGGGADELRVGLRVSVEGHVICGRCRNCRSGRRHMCIRTNSIGVNRDGAFADFVVVPAANVWVQSDVIDPDLGAVFDPLGNAVHTALQAEIPGDDVLITGAGPIGIMAAAVVRHAGARHVVVTDVSEYRLELARRVGVTRAVDVVNESLADVRRELGMTEGFDIALEMSGAPSAFADIIENCTHGADVGLLGIPSEQFCVDWGKVITNMLVIRGVYGRKMFSTWYRMSFMLQSSAALRDQVRSVITHRFAPEDWQDAFGTARSGQCGKVIFDWGE
ncbi:MAG TPA: L-threonine 3-dehydrogenase [Actinomycetaceae bacterium]|nr:L-threonine 3-dehydrogenase [Actinomycetaceae bacterium]